VKVGLPPCKKNGDHHCNLKILWFWTFSAYDCVEIYELIGFYPLPYKKNLVMCHMSEYAQSYALRVQNQRIFKLQEGSPNFFL